MTTAVEEDAPEVEAPGIAPLTLSEAGSWLCSRNETLRNLVERIGAWEVGNGPMMGYIRDSVIAHDSQYLTNTYAGRQLSQMLPSAVAQLRMLATLAPVTYDDQRVQFSVRDLESFNRTNEGRALIEMYLRVVREGVLGG